MDKDNQPTPSKTEYKVSDGQALAGDQGQQMTGPHYSERQGRMTDEARQMVEADGAATKHTETDEQFARKLEDNIEEIKATDAAGRQVQENLAKQAPISEDEAKRLLTEEKRLAEIEYKNAQGKGKKTLMIVLVVAAVLCVLGGAFAIAMANRGDEEKKDDQGGVNVDDGDKEQVGGNSPGGDDTQVSDEVTELSLDNALVQRLYSDF